MENSAETLFNDLGQRYEDAYANSPHLKGFLHAAIDHLPPDSRVLDVGCGTGTPVASMLASAGHHVHGIDVSQEMLSIARRQVKGTFEKADMRAYSPASPVDGLFVIFSLYQIPPGETYSMCFRFSEWLNPGGMLVIATSPGPSPHPSSNVDLDFVVHDATWDATRYFQRMWMGTPTIETLFTADAWRAMLRDAGFSITAEVVYDFAPQDANHNVNERHQIFLARKVHDNPLLGPFPMPTLWGPWESPSPLNGIVDHLVGKELDLIRAKIFNKPNVLYLGPPMNDIDLQARCTQFHGPIDTLPFSSEKFERVLALCRLDHVADHSKTLSEILRVTSQTKGSQIIFIQAAPDNEILKIFNSLPHSPKIPHQGALLGAAMEQLSEDGSRDISLTRVDAKYQFPGENVSQKCEDAMKMLSGLYQPGDAEELRSRLRLHFRDGAQPVGCGLAMLEATSVSN
ncbi:S-adenosyl-L-methionine-dependent methyltransferase [Aspergillus aurantiobrunneus]